MSLILLADCGIDKSIKERNSVYDSAVVIERIKTVSRGKIKDLTSELRKNILAYSY